MKSLFLGLAALALPTTATAQSAKTCLTQDEAAGLVTYILPLAVRAVAKQCSSILPATAPLIQSGPVLAGRYQAAADEAWPLAKVAFDKMSGLKIGAALGDEGLKGVMDASLGPLIANEVKPNDCPKIDRVVNILEPLPAKNMAMLITTLVEFGSESGKATKKNPLSICPAKPAN